MKPTVCHRIAGFLSDQPLFIEPQALKSMLDAIGPRFGLMDAQASDDPDSFAAMKRKAVHERLAAIVGAEPIMVGDGMCEYGRTPEGVAIVPVVGTTINRYDWLAAWCGLTAYETIKLAVQAADADPLVKAILLDVDSPGGEAAGMLDCADIIRACSKTVWASANTLAASAGYGLAAAAERLTLGRLSTVGSVGVVGIHIDQSAYDKEMGLKYTPIYSGARKIDGWSHAPLSPEVKARFQARFDEARATFAGAVADFRGISIDAVLATEAETYDDQAAVDVGFADAVQSFDETLAELTAEITPTAGTSSGVGTWRFAHSENLKEIMMSKKNVAASTAIDPKAENQAAQGQAPAEEAKAEPAAPADAPKDEEGDDEEEGDGKKAADPADVAAYCADHGAPKLAAQLIRDKATMEGVKAKVGAASEIRTMCKAARATGAAIDAGFEDDAIDKGMTVDAARKALFDKMIAAQSPEISARAPDAHSAGHAEIDRKSIYDKRRQQTTANT